VESRPGKKGITTFGCGGVSVGKGLAKAEMFEVEEEGNEFVEGVESLSWADCCRIATYAARWG
jgi:hypothetical protein